MSFFSDPTQAPISNSGKHGDSMPTRIAIWALLSISFALTAALVFRYVDETRQVIHTQAVEIAATAAEFARFEVAANDRIALAFRLEAFTGFSQVRAMVIMDRREQTLAAVLRNSAGNLSASPESTIALERMNHDASPQSGIIRIEDSFVVRAAIGEIAPIGWVYVEYDNGWLLKTRRALALGLVSTALMLATASALLWRFRRAR